MTTQQLAKVLGVQHELVRDAAGSAGVSGRLLEFPDVMRVKTMLLKWGKLPKAQQPVARIDD